MRPQFEKVTTVPVVDLAEDRAGNIWAAAWDRGLLEVTRAGEIRRYEERQGFYFVDTSRFSALKGRRYTPLVYAVAVDGQGSIWVGTHSGLCKLRRRRPAADGSIIDHIYTNEISNSSFTILCLYVTRSGRLRVGSRGGASEWTGDKKQPFRHWGAAQGITDRGVHAIAEDGAGNLWMATGDLGAKRIARDGLISFRRADGLSHGVEDAPVSAFTESRNGDLFAITLFDSLVLNRFDGDRFTAIRPAFPNHIRWFGWGHGSIGFEDREGSKGCVNCHHRRGSAL